MQLCCFTMMGLLSITTSYSSIHLYCCMMRGQIKDTYSAAISILGTQCYISPKLLNLENHMKPKCATICTNQ